MVNQSFSLTKYSPSYIGRVPYFSNVLLNGVPIAKLKVIKVQSIVVDVEFHPKLHLNWFKLVEAWKSIHIPSYPFKLEESNPNRQDGDRCVRSTTTKKWKDYALSKGAS